MDDVGIGRRIRAVRVHKGLRQEDVARLADISRAGISRIEHGRFEAMTLATLRRVGRALDVQFESVVRWRGGDLDRMVNARHAALHESAARIFAACSGWVAVPEASFNVFGERGAIDVLAWHPVRRALLVVELKSEIVDVQALLGVVDRYRRLAPRIAVERGWSPLTVSTWVAIGAGRTNERSLGAHRTVLRAAFPADGRQLAAWLREPAGRLDALGFLPYARPENAGHAFATPRRVRRRIGGA